jgi:hypothetical protein
VEDCAILDAQFLNVTIGEESENLSRFDHETAKFLDSHDATLADQSSYIQVPHKRVCLQK